MYSIVRLSEQLSEEHIVIHSSCESAEDILREMIQILLNELGPEVCEDVAKAVITRERIKSTGIGYGVAVPHARTSLVKQLYCIVATSKKGIEFKALDGKPVSLFFLVISPDFTVGPHLNIISAISHLVGKNTKISEEFNKALSPSEFMEILKAEEEKLIN